MIDAHGESLHSVRVRFETMVELPHVRLMGIATRHQCQLIDLEGNVGWTWLGRLSRSLLTFRTLAPRWRTTWWSEFPLRRSRLPHFGRRHFTTGMGQPIAARSQRARRNHCLHHDAE
jgi:hypothetical protein